MSNNEVILSNQQAVSSENTALMAMIERVCLSPDADIAKLEKMLDMQERILDRNAKQAFSADFAAMQRELPRIAENGQGHNNAKYALLEDINDSVRPVLYKYGFGVSFSIDQNDSKVTVKAKLSHKLGHYEETCLSLPLDTSGNKNAVQAAGSTISYGKRYAICALLNISTGDDVDGDNPNPVTESYVGMCERLSEHIAEIKIGIQKGDLGRASSAWATLSEEDKTILWRAPTKGGCFTTEERAIMKTSEFRESMIKGQ